METETPEWKILVRLCRGVLEPKHRDAALTLLRREEIHVPTLIEHAMRHRMVPMLAHLVMDEEDLPLPTQLRGELLGALLTNRERVGRLGDAAAEAVGALKREGVRVAVTKGLALASTVYGGHGVRKMMDADLMIHPQDRATVSRVLEELGFQQGLYDWKRHQITELPARRRAVYRLSPDHLPHFMRLEPYRGGTLVIDVANSVTWTHSEWQVPMEAVLEDLEEAESPGSGAPLPVLGPPWQFLFTTLHLFREAWFVETAQAGKDMLYKYSDLLGLWRRHRSVLSTMVPELVGRYGLQQPVAWVLEHTDRTFGSDLAAGTGLSGAASEDFLASAVAPGGHPMRWSGTMNERLCRANRADLFEAVPEPL